MPTSEQAERLIKISDMLVEQVTKLNKRIVTLSNKQKHTQWAVAAMSAILFVVVIVGGLAELNRVDNKVDKSVDAQLATCESQNVSRAESKAMWDKNAMAVRSLAPGNPGLQKYAADIQNQAAKTFGQKDCSLLEEGKSAPLLPATPSQVSPK